ncbi:hypothetical protein SLEP1_g35939 [Rubroshorea leprosula]|uniref:Uncharacterized protein n=1 Tax=Rubroshorea leprosula TaxID=152421 RepID=A0AAV5KQF0_9ROSI|nr:hypothetical protein SLEP1_g35939 [Rubroshorea leprosula]
MNLIANILKVQGLKRKEIRIRIKADIFVLSHVFCSSSSSFSSPLPTEAPLSHRLIPFEKKLVTSLIFSLPFLVKELILGPRTLPLKWEFQICSVSSPGSVRSSAGCESFGIFGKNQLQVHLFNFNLAWVTLIPFVSCYLVVVFMISSPVSVGLHSRQLRFWLLEKYCYVDGIFKSENG